MNTIAREIDMPSAGSGVPARLFRFMLTWFGRAHTALARGFALFLGGFALLNLAGGIVVPGFDANIWWIDLHRLPAPLESALIGLSGLGLLAYGVHPAAGRLRRIVTLLLVGIASAAAIGNAAIFYGLLGAGTITTSFPLPFSLFIAAGLGLVGSSLLLPSRRDDRSRPLLLITTVVACLVLFPLMQMLCFGYTDYRRPADAAVVFGARAYADGTPSVALGDRVRTACDLYHQGLAPRLIFSGGAGDGAVHETEAMRRMALDLGVPDSAILLDRRGVNTQATAEETGRMLERIGAREVMAVSHFYHLPRVKMAYHRLGWNVYTVPAEESYTLSAMPIYMLREIAGLWVYYLGGFRNG